MIRKTLPLICFLLLSSLIPLVSANAPTQINMEFGVQGSGEAVPGQGYWIYGEFWNKGFESKREVIIEVTLYDAQSGVLDIVTTVVRPTIVNPGEKAGFLVKSTTVAEVVEEKIIVKSYKDTRNTNFQYLELSDIVTNENGVSGKLSNTHFNIYVFEAEVIASFYDADGNVVDVQSYGALSYAQFDAGVTVPVNIATSKDFDSYTLLVQCNRVSRDPYFRLSVEREGAFSSKVGEPIILIIEDNPQRSIEYMEVTITDPNGNAATQQFYQSEQRDYRYSITPETPGRWNVTLVSEPYLVNNSIALVEDGEMSSGFLVWDPNAEVDGSTETPEPGDGSSSENNTGVIVDVDSLTSSASELIDSVSSSADELVESLPEEVKQQIPGFPVSSLVAAFMVVFVLFSRKN